MKRYDLPDTTIESNRRELKPNPHSKVYNPKTKAYEKPK